MSAFYSVIAAKGPGSSVVTKVGRPIGMKREYIPTKHDFVLNEELQLMAEAVCKTKLKIQINPSQNKDMMEIPKEMDQFEEGPDGSYSIERHF